MAWEWLKMVQNRSRWPRHGLSKGLSECLTVFRMSLTNENWMLEDWLRPNMGRTARAVAVHRKR